LGKEERYCSHESRAADTTRGREYALSHPRPEKKNGWAVIIGRIKMVNVAQEILKAPRAGRKADLGAPGGWGLLTLDDNETKGGGGKTYLLKGRKTLDQGEKERR